MGNTSIQVVDHTAKVKRQMQQNVQQALTAIGQTGVELTTDYMRGYYGRPIYLTGDLIRSIAYRVDGANERTHIGTNLGYGPPVHNGTRKMKGRPFLKDAVLNNKSIFKEVAKEHLARGMN